MEVKAQPNTALSTLGQSTIEPNQSFLFGNGSEGTSTNAPTPPKMPQSPLAVDSSSVKIPPAPPPVPPTAPAMPDLVGDASIGAKPEGKSALLESIRNFGKGV